jgi:hypothetical protein
VTDWCGYSGATYFFDVHHSFMVHSLKDQQEDFAIE